MLVLDKAVLQWGLSLRYLTLAEVCDCMLRWQLGMRKRRPAWQIVRIAVVECTRSFYLSDELAGEILWRACCKGLVGNTVRMHDSPFLPSKHRRSFGGCAWSIMERYRFGWCVRLSASALDWLALD